MRRALLICALAAVALAATACGSGGANALQSVAGAATKTAGTQSVRVHVDLAETVGPVGPLRLTADGVSDNSTHSADMTMDLSSIGSLIGSQPAGPNLWKAHAILDGRNGGSVLYLQLPALDRYLNGKTWVKADLQKLAKKAGVDLDQLLQTVGNQDPTQALQALEAVGHVSKTGSAKIDGVDTTEYSGSIDVAKAIALLAGGGGSLQKLLRRADVSSIPVDVWIGSDGLVRRAHEKFATAVRGAGEVTTDLTIDLSDFGLQTNIQPPPAAEVVDVGALEGVRN